MAAVNGGFVPFRSHAIRAGECLNAGWQLARERYGVLLGICFIGMLLASLAPLAILLGPMTAGIYLAYFRLMDGEPIELGTLFKGFDHFVPTLVATLVVLGIVIALTVPFVGLVMVSVLATAAAGSAGGPPQEPSPLVIVPIVVLALVYFVAVVAVYFLTVFAIPLVVDRGLEPIAALRTSARAAMANLGGLVGLALLSMLMGFLGLLLCYVGIFFVAPVLYGTLAVAYRAVFPRPAAPEGAGAPVSVA